ncbi:MAG: ATP-dependent DNA helicase RecG [Spirochaetaceae bacterium]|jgi:ATP-dependent DNA helicase RecG|nr:ATP-dependent DNA helicase RecG [Spirochaetaceae bacterium]
MLLRELTMPLDTIKGIGPVAVKVLAKRGIDRVQALLCHYPRTWEDRSCYRPLKDFRLAPVCTVVRILARDWFFNSRTGKQDLKVYVEDQGSRAVLVCYNQPFMERLLVVGAYYWLWGTFQYKFGELQSSSFEVEALPAGTPPPSLDTGAPLGKLILSRNFGRILPVYPLSEGLTQGKVRRFMEQALDQYPSLEDEVPAHLLKQRHLLPKAQALRALHFPPSLAVLEQARKTLIYEELFSLELLIAQRALARRTLVREDALPNQEPLQDGSPIAGDPGSWVPLQRRLLECLPFRLTPGQEAVMRTINQEMDGPYPMARLLQGDVGSGKTLVSLLAALRGVERSGQTALMAPTELLARQHGETAARLLEPLGVRCGFLSGNLKAQGRTQTLKRLSAGELDLVVGTHALFSKDVQYKSLRLVIIDEQHRFGVLQRQAIMDKGEQPDLLMMSATPIPRTLALTIFGDLDISVIRDLPPGRKPVITHLTRESNETKVYDFVRKELSAGRQAYFVYPLIEADDRSSLKAAQSMAARLSGEVFPQHTVALIHGKLDEDTKRRTMEAFRTGEVRVLVATSVVEVGVDVPNASCMVIEQAERFGLAALHQLRGRVGRGEVQSYCFLIYSDATPSGTSDSALTDQGKARLKVMLESTDGFVIAEEDLKLRGPGHITGTEQAGFLALGIADPLRDTVLLEQARTDAFATTYRGGDVALDGPHD